VIDRRAFIAGATALLAAPFAAEAQQTGQIKKVGFLFPWPPPPDDADPVRLRNRAAVHDELRNHGWIEGQNLIIERRYAAGQIDQLEQLAAELVALEPDLIYAASGTAAVAIRKANTSIPIVTHAGDMVGQGLVSNLARPDGNVTGLNLMLVEIAGKRLHLLRELLPRASRIAVLGCGDTRSPGTNMGLSWPYVEAAARALRVQLLQYAPQTPDDIKAALNEASRNRADGLLLLDCARFNAITDKSIFLRHRLPAIYYLEPFAQAGGLMVYGPDEAAFYRRTGWYIGRILNGAKPADLPVEQPRELRLVINLKTAKALGLTIPPSLLLRADQVIE